MSEKIDVLRKLIQETGGMAIGFSGGVDSTFLAAVAKDVLGDRALAVTLNACITPTEERNTAQKMAAKIGIRHIVIELDVLSVPHFTDNPTNRCYYCKREVFRAIRRVAREQGIDTVADGTNADDLGDDRPGMRAIKEEGVCSPLLEVGMTKREIRELSARMGLETADKPPMACLATRVPYGETITEEKLRAIDAAEEALREMGFRHVRVRHHGAIGRIELPESDLARTCESGVREKIVKAVQDAGFRYVTLDLAGYRAGSMREAL